MIQVYIPSNTNFGSNGDCVLVPTSCELSTEINGTWELTMSHPLDSDGRWKYISEESVISAPTFQSDNQLFRVEKCIKTDDSVEVTAYPIFFDSADDCFLMDIRPTNQNGQNALDIMTQNSKYSGESDITTGGTAYFVRRNLMDAINGEDSPTFIKTWGGEILYDNYKVIINERIGGDYGAEIRYGKNMDGISYTVNMADVVTRIVPVAYNGRTMSGDAPWVDSENIEKYAKIYTREVTFDDVKLAEDASDSEEDDVIICDDQSALDAALKRKCEDMYAAGADLPEVTIEVTMIDLAKADQYKDFKNLVSVGLGDSVGCYNYKLDITTTARVIKLTWDCIKNEAGEMTIGEYQYNYFSELTSSLQAIKQVIGPGNTVMAERVSGVLNAINTQLRYQKNIAQKQDVRAILFEDTDPDSPTYGAMCLGTQGFQIADKRTEDGKDWDWTTAFTAKGGYANTIITGMLSDKTGKNFWNLDTGEFQLSSTATVDGEKIATQNQTIKNVDVEYATGTSDTVPPEEGWSTNSPQWEKGKYIWQRTVTTMADGTILISEPACIQGADGSEGVGISQIAEQYYLSTSNTTQTGGGWSEDQPEWASGKYIWTRSKVTWTDKSVTYTDPVLAKAINGANQSASDAKNSVSNLDKELDQEGVFNRLTNNGTVKGIYLESNQLYINADFIKTGILNGQTIKGSEFIGGRISIMYEDSDGDSQFSFVANENGVGIGLGGEFLKYNSGDSFLTLQGEMRISSGKITGYKEGYIGFQLNQTQLDLYSWNDLGKYAGTIGSVKNEFTGRTGIEMWCANGGLLFLGYDDGSGTAGNIKTILSFDSKLPDNTPFIANTASGRIFPNNGTGVVVENGLIKSWNLESLLTGDIVFYSSSGNQISIHVKSGLISGWDLG